MKDPIVEEVRQIRADHTNRFNGDLRRICDDLRKLEAKYKDRIATPEQRRQQREAGQPD